MILRKGFRVPRKRPSKYYNVRVTITKKSVIFFNEERTDWKEIHTKLVFLNFLSGAAITIR